MLPQALRCPLNRVNTILPRHQERLAVVYVRQSTVQQVLNHQESTRLQYGLVERAEALGWPKERILVIDDDLGKSGSTSEGRQGFQRLVAEVGLDQVGLILGIEMSRLARSNKDWHHLLEICALFGTLIADNNGVYDASQYSDRLLLGLTGMMSEAELHLLKQRMFQGKLNKARRGELGFTLPIGYIRRPSGEVILDPDEQVRNVVRLIFGKFEELGTLNAVLRYLVEHNIELGIRVRTGPAKGELEWRRPNRMTLQNLLKSPIYAGAYVYGRRQVDPRKKQQEFALFRRRCPRQAQRRVKRQKARSVADILNTCSYLSGLMAAPFVHSPAHIQGKSGIERGLFSRSCCGWCPKANI
jgi:DNA invertase Pin-like site-specific DNA recombinase